MTTDESVSVMTNEINCTSTLDGLILSDAEGYELPVFGLDNGEFYYIHGIALVCMMSSFVCATLSIVYSFKHHKVKRFYNNWSKSDRFVVYLALCDALFNICHSLDHSHMLITRDHVRPKELCTFYAFFNGIFIIGQMLLVNIIAINAFMIMDFNININFGPYDWRLLLWAFGVAFTGSIVAATTQQYVPSGYYCGVKRSAVLWFSAIPLLVVLAINIVLYALTWKRIHQQAKLIQRIIGCHSQSEHASSRTARSMSLFVTAFFIQWTPLGVYSVWTLLTSNIHKVMRYAVVIFCNIGGCLNLAVFVIIRRARHQAKHEHDTRSAHLHSLPTVNTP